MQFGSAMNMDTLFRIRTLAQYSLYEGWRGHVFLTSVLLVLICAALAEFSGLLVLTDTWQTRVAIYAFTARISLVSVIAIYVINSLIRDRIDKQTEWHLSIDSPRYAYLYGRVTGFLVTGLLMAIVTGIYPLLYAQNMDVLLWLSSLYAEIAVVIMLAVFIAVTFNNSVLGFITAGAFYILARNIGNFILISQSPVLEGENETVNIASRIIETVHYVIPDFWQYADSRWLLYGDGSLAGLSAILVEALIFSLLLLFAASIDLYRKNL